MRRSLNWKWLVVLVAMFVLQGGAPLCAEADRDEVTKADSSDDSVAEVDVVEAYTKALMVAHHKCVSATRDLGSCWNQFAQIGSARGSDARSLARVKPSELMLTRGMFKLISQQYSVVPTELHRIGTTAASGIQADFALAAPCAGADWANRFPSLRIRSGSFLQRGGALSKEFL